MKGNIEHIKEVEDRLQFTIILGMFFPVLVEALSNLINSDIKEVFGMVLKAGLWIFILILNYLVFEGRKNKLTERQLDYLSWSFFATIACYGSVFLFLAFVANGNVYSVNQIMEFVYGFVIFGSMYFPVVSLAVMVVEFLVSKIKK